MIEDDRYCMEIATQLQAVESLVHKARREVLRAHLSGCVQEAFETGDEQPARPRSTRSSNCSTRRDRPPARALAPVEQAAALLTHCAHEEQQAAGLRICGADLSGTQLECLRLHGVLFEGCRLTGCSWARADLTDVVFRRCELSNSDWRDAFFARVDFADCKAVGASFAGTGWRAASFDGCALSYAVFDHARLRDVSFSGCDLSQTSLHTCTWKNLRLDKTSLRQRACCTPRSRAWT